MKKCLVASISKINNFKYFIEKGEKEHMANKKDVYSRFGCPSTFFIARRVCARAYVGIMLIVRLVIGYVRIQFLTKKVTE